MEQQMELGNLRSDLRRSATVSVAAIGVSPMARARAKGEALRFVKVSHLIGGTPTSARETRAIPHQL
jgi:hypothetical protein